MKARILIAAAMCLTVLGWSVAGGSGDAAPVAAELHDHHAGEIGKCALICDQCSAHCAQLLSEGKKEHYKSMQACQDCASICGTTACLTARKGPYATLMWTACAETCKLCGDQCETMKDDKMMAACAAECRKCEKHCRDMAKSNH
jgi:hypothetical protein